MQLVLTHMHLADKEGVPLALALENNATLRTLDLSHNDLGDRTAAALGNSLGVSCKRLYFAFARLTGWLAGMCTRTQQEKRPCLLPYLSGDATRAPR
jgi:hypothetical protein